MLRIRWPPWFGINGRLAPDYAVGYKMTHIVPEFYNFESPFLASLFGAIEVQIKCETVEILDLVDDFIPICGIV